MFFHQTNAFWHDYNVDSEDNFHANDDAVANYDDADSEDNFPADSADNDDDVDQSKKMCWFCWQ